MRPRARSPATSSSAHQTGSGAALRWALCGSAVLAAGAIWLRARATPPERGRSDRSAVPAPARSETRALQTRAKRVALDDREATHEAAAREPSPERPPPGDAEMAARRDAGAESSEAAAAQTPERSLASVDVGAAADPLPAALPRAAEPAARELLPAAPAAPQRAPHRRVEIATLHSWQLPGLCGTEQSASAAHDTLMRRFRVVERDDGARVYLDPRLPEGAHLPLQTHLAEAQRHARDELGLSAGSPEVFAYHDRELLLAAACTNDDVVAYYDGALHVVVTRDDVQQSVIHEYAHHALMTHGILGPTWAQEGIAMHVAGETWWRSQHWLEKVTEHPFSLESMERAIPYTLSSEQAVLFYVQAAAMVACAAREQPEGVAGLVGALGASHSKSEVSYALVVPGTPAELRVCVRTLLAGDDPAAERR